jgi:GH24 family phage-related lysozyme (muramidase)
MQTSAIGRAFIELFEGLSLTAYRDSVGVLTIGYGHTTAAGPPTVFQGQSITRDDADNILSTDLGKVEANVMRCIDVALEQCEFDTLASFDFNTGCLARSSLVPKLNSGDKSSAMATLLLYDHAGGRELAGLTRRRQAEKLMFEGRVVDALKLAGASAGTIAKATLPANLSGAPL